jgi:hypothetical protein
MSDLNDIKAISKAYLSMLSEAKEPDEIQLDENKNLMKDYQDLKDKGKKDSDAIEILMSMPKYRKMSRDQISKIIGDQKRKGVFKR